MTELSDYKRIVEKPQIAALEATVTRQSCRIADLGEANATLIQEKREMEAVLRKLACSCPGPCERRGNSPYADRDMCCEAHDALTPGDTP